MNYFQKHAFWFIAILMIIGVVGILLVSTDTNTTDTSDQATTTTTKSLYLSQAPAEKITLVEYSDFQCPACANMYSLLEQAKQEFGDEVTFEFRHFPLTSIHPNAMTAHRIAQAADYQGAFVDVHDLLFQNTDSWTSTSNPSQAIYNIITASIPSVDIEQLKTDVSKSETLGAINEDLASGRALDVQGTPSLFINDVQINVVSYESLRSALQNELQ